MAREQLPRLRRRDAEKVSHPPGSKAPPRSPAIRREVYLALRILTRAYLDTV